MSEEKLPAIVEGLLVKIVKLFDDSNDEYVSFNPAWFPKVCLEIHTSKGDMTKDEMKFRIKKTSRDIFTTSVNGDYLIKREAVGAKRQNIPFYVRQEGRRIFYNRDDFPWLDEEEEVVRKTTMGMYFYDQLFRKVPTEPVRMLKRVRKIHRFYRKIPRPLRPLRGDFVVAKPSRGDEKKAVVPTDFTKLPKIGALFVLDYVRFLGLLLFFSQDQLVRIRPQLETIGMGNKIEPDLLNHVWEYFIKVAPKSSRYQPELSRNLKKFWNQVKWVFNKFIPLGLYENVIKYITNPKSFTIEEQSELEFEWKETIKRVLNTIDMNAVYKKIRQRLVLIEVYRSVVAAETDEELITGEGYDSTNILDMVNLSIDNFTFLNQLLDILIFEFTAKELRYYLRAFNKITKPKRNVFEEMVYNDELGKYKIVDMTLNMEPTISRNAIAKFFEDSIEDGGGGLQAVEERFGLFLEFLEYAVSGLLMDVDEDGSLVFTKSIPTSVIENVKKFIRIRLFGEQKETRVSQCIGSSITGHASNTLWHRFSSWREVLPHELPLYLNCPKVSVSKYFDRIGSSVEIPQTLKYPYNTFYKEMTDERSNKTFYVLNSKMKRWYEKKDNDLFVYLKH